jgi:sugar/nucleoside kinase (ribokinase family)
VNLPFKLASHKPFDVVGLGLNAVDFLCVVPHFPAYDSKLKMLHFRQAGGGQAATAMVACRRLGLKTRYVGKTGGGDFGDYSRKSLVEGGVDTEGVAVVPDTRNQCAFILIDEGTGERTIIWDRDSRLSRHPGEVPREIICSAQVLLIDGHDAAAAVQAARFARGEGMCVIMDAERISDETAELVSLSHVVIGEKRFPERFTGCGNLKEGLTQITGRGPQIAGVTLGREGALALYDGRFYHSPAYEVSCRDTTGAGDVFHAAFIRALFEDWDLTRCLDFSNAVAALKCRDLGGRAGLPSFSEAIAFMENGKRLTVRHAGF